MRIYGASGLFAGLPEVVDQALEVNKFASKTAALNLGRRGCGAGAATLVPALFDLLDRNWVETLKAAGSQSRENFRWYGVISDGDGLGRYPGTMNKVFLRRAFKPAPVRTAVRLKNV